MLENNNISIPVLTDSGTGEYCCLNLPYLQQFWTDIPAQAPDNTFLGQFLKPPNTKRHTRAWTAMLMGKEMRYFRKPHVKEAIEILCQVCIDASVHLEIEMSYECLSDKNPCNGINFCSCRSICLFMQQSKNHLKS